MKYGILFGTVAILLIVAATMHSGWYLVCVWPAISFGIVSIAYLGFGPKAYGKSSAGVLSGLNVLLLLPYLLYLWAVWYLIRVIKKENAYDQLTDKIYIGRRLLNHEFPIDRFDHVVDLTCEFTEPKSLRSANYHSFQILDGFVPPTQQLQVWLTEARGWDGTIYIHCAEGHGRTGLFAAGLLVELGQFDNPHDALAFVISKRPLVRLGTRQWATLLAAKPA